MVEAKQISHDDLSEYFPKERSKRIKQGTIGQVLLLESLETQKHVFLANTHIFWKPNSADVKLLQVHNMHVQMEAFREQHKDKSGPFIFCGDFNCGSASGIYKYITQKKFGLGAFDTFLGIDQRLEEQDFSDTHQIYVSGLADMSEVQVRKVLLSFHINWLIQFCLI